MPAEKSSEAPARPATRPRGRLAALDGLRLVAALAVGTYHYTDSWRIDGHSLPEHYFPTLSHISIYGFLGVELFFLISGFVVCMSSWNRRLGDFFTSRVSRLYPAYWCCIAITTVVVILLPVTGGVPVSGIPQLHDIAVNLTMLHEPLGVPAVDTVYWTLFVELRFYLLFGLLVWRGLTYRRAVLFCAAWMTVAALAPAVHNELINVVFITAYAPYFIGGIVLHLIHRYGPTPLLLGMVAMTWLVSIHLVTVRVSEARPGFPVPTWPGVLVITAAYAALLVIALGWTDGIRWRWLTVAGALTYPFYLLHQRIGYSLIRHAHLHTSLPAWSLLIGTLILLLALAWLVHRWVERPLAAVIRSVLPRAIAEARQVGTVEARPTEAQPTEAQPTEAQPTEAPVAAVRPVPRQPDAADVRQPTPVSVARAGFRP